MSDFSLAETGAIEENFPGKSILDLLQIHMFMYVISTGKKLGQIGLQNLALG
eukprot:gene13087-14429_t